MAQTKALTKTYAEHEAEIKAVTEKRLAARRARLSGAEAVAAEGTGEAAAPVERTRVLTEAETRELLAREAAPTASAAVSAPATAPAMATPAKAGKKDGGEV